MADRDYQARYRFDAGSLAENLARCEIMAGGNVVADDPNNVENSASAINEFQTAMKELKAMIIT